VVVGILHRSVIFHLEYFGTIPNILAKKLIKKLFFGVKSWRLAVKLLTLRCDNENRSNMELTRKATTIRLPEYMLADLSSEARKQGVSVSRLIEDRLEESLYRPNKETLEAMEECRSGVELEDFDPDELDKYIYAEVEEVGSV
jgi:hypothetical protein